MAATVFARQRVSGLDRCAYSVGPAPEVRGRLFVPLAGPWWLEGEACRSAEGGVWDDLCERPTRAGPTARADALRASGDISLRPGTCRRGRGRSTPSGTGILSPNAWAVPGWSGPHPAARNVPAGVWNAVVCGRRQTRSAPVLRRPPARNCRESGWKTWIPIHTKDPWVTNQIYLWYI